jgi:hypothetical protein
MTVSLDEHRLGSLRWIVLTGPDREAFRALGEHVRGELTALAQAWPALTRLRRHVSGSPGRDRLSAVRRATAARFGCHAFVEAGAESGPLLWHTNHGRYVPGAKPSSRGTSVARGEILDTLAVPASDPSLAWFLSVLAAAPLPDGVRAEPGPDSRATTLCTFAVDLTAGQAVVAARDDDPVAIPLQDLAEGNPRAQRALESTW